LEHAPQVDGYGVRLVDACTLEVDIAQGSGFTRVFTSLAQQGVEVDHVVIVDLNTHQVVMLVKMVMMGNGACQEGLV